jgi:ADP-heptose:LPS heptosyltransferase
MSQAFNMQRASKETNVDIEYYRCHAEMLEDNMQKIIYLCIHQQDKEQSTS